MRANRRIVLQHRPTDKLVADDFRLETTEVADPGPGEILGRTILLSLDPANRAWMQGRTYRSQLEEGDLMAGFSMMEVVAENGTGVPVGSVVSGDGGWQEYALLPAKAVEVLRPTAPLTHHMGVLGITGLTAYFGLFHVGALKEGDTVVVSAAAGATGSVVGQLAKLRGNRVVGIAGGADKCRALVEQLGYDAAVDHRSPTLVADLRAACPQGIDVYFDNVGGPVLEAALGRMNMHGRIVCCGVVSQYDTNRPASGPQGVPGFLVTKRLRMEGFIVMDFHEHWEQATREMSGWLADGRLTPLEDVLDGLESAPEGLVGLLAGANIGKRMVRVGPDPR